MAKRKPVDIKDLFRLRLVSDVRVSPDGRRVAFVHTTLDYEKDEYMSDIWLADVIVRRGTAVHIGEGEGQGATLVARRE